MQKPTAHPPDSWHRARPPAVKPRLALFRVGVAAALAGLLIAYALNDKAAPAPSRRGDAPAAASQLSPMAAPAQVAAAIPATSVPSSTSSSAPPPWKKPADPQTAALSLTELKELQQALAGSSPDDELTRLSEQVLLADAARRFLELRSSANPDQQELHGLVELIGPLLDAQLQRGDLARADALELKAKLLQVRYPQAAMQQAELTRWLAAQPVR